MESGMSKPKHRPYRRISKGTVKKSEITMKARLWFDVAGETYLAPGRVTLLERVDQYGSITKAAKSMEMSYRHAWLLVDDMNSKAPAPLVTRASGGKGGGGTFLTDEGKIAVQDFNKLQKKLKNFMQELEI